MKYSRYKFTTSAWLGNVPDHWQETKIGRVCSKVGSGKTPRGGAEIYTEEGILFIRSQNVHNDGLHLDDVAWIPEEIDDNMVETRVFSHDVLLNITGASLGRSSLVVDEIGPANVNQHVCIIRPIPALVNPYFLWYSILSQPVQQQIVSFENGSSREGLNFTQVRALSIVVPPLPEQEIISRFLRVQVSKIETLIRKKEELIRKLREKRSALISRTVTRGLPPEAAKAAALNPYPKLKNSGIPWLGEMAAHWGLKKLSWIFQIQGRIGWRGYTVADLRDEADGILVLGAMNIGEKGNLDLSKTTFLSREKYDESPEIKLTGGELLVVKVGATIGKVGIVPNWQREATINPNVMILRRSEKDNSFFHYQLLGAAFQSELSLDKMAGAQDAINQEQIGRIKLLVPPKSEQLAIAKYLDEALRKLDRAIEKVETAIEKLTEYRFALVTAAVTGKIDLRNYR